MAGIREAASRVVGRAVAAVVMVPLNLVGHTSVGIEDFRACYWKGVQTGIEKRRGAGLPVPESVNLQPPVDIDLD
jgi:hypothetical protein